MLVDVRAAFLKDQCPNCGAELEPNAKVCPECGSDETTGWSDEARNEDFGLPDDSFDYDEFVKKEFGKEDAKPHGLPWFWWLIAVLVVAGILWFSIR